MYSEDYSSKCFLLPQNVLAFCARTRLVTVVLNQNQKCISSKITETIISNILFKRLLC